jgi:hypothetical protein
VSEKPTAPVVSTPQSSPTQDLPKTAAVQQNRKILFQDDFKDPGSGWRTFADDFGEGKYENGSYILKSSKAIYNSQFRAYTTNPVLTSLTSFTLDMDVTMLEGSRDDYYGVAVMWPDINPMNVVGYVQPSNFYFFVNPVGMTTWAYSKQFMKDSGADMIPGYFLETRNSTSVKGIGSINNVKISLIPDIHFLINDTELVNTPDDSLDYVKRLIKDKTITGGSVQIFALSRKEFNTASFQLNKIAVYAGSQ